MAGDSRPQLSCLKPNAVYGCLEYDLLSGFLGRCYGAFVGFLRDMFWFHNRCFGTYCGYVMVL